MPARKPYRFKTKYYNYEKQGMANGETVERILRAATILFAERGFAETSLRTITGMADVNLAAVNYHFGNKKSLIQAVFSQFLTPFCEELERRLDMLEASLQGYENPKIEPLLKIGFDALNASTASINEKPERFLRLIGLAYTQSQEHLRQTIAHKYEKTYQRYVGWLYKTVPNLDPIIFYWRINFILGASIFTLSSFDSIQAILSDEHSVDIEMQGAVSYLIPALAGMLSNPHASADA